MCVLCGNVRLRIVCICTATSFESNKILTFHVLMCQEIAQGYYYRKAATPRCLIKIDLRKAYESLQGDLIEEILH